MTSAATAPMIMLLTPAQTAARTGLAVSTLAKLRVRGGGPRYRKCGARVMYLERDVTDWLESQPVYSSTSEYTPPSGRRPGRPRRTSTAADA